MKRTTHRGRLRVGFGNLLWFVLRLSLLNGIALALAWLVGALLALRIGMPVVVASFPIALYALLAILLNLAYPTGCVYAALDARFKGHRQSFRAMEASYFKGCLLLMILILIGFSLNYLLRLMLWFWSIA